MNSTSVWVVIAAVVVAFGLYRVQVAAASGKQAHEWVSQGAKLVDVRTAEEFAAGHLAGAINVPVQQLPDRAAEIGAPTQKVVVYCRSGARSARAARLLEAAGFKQILDLGPMSAW